MILYLFLAALWCYYFLSFLPLLGQLSKVPKSHSNLIGMLRKFNVYWCIKESPSFIDLSDLAKVKLIPLIIIKSKINILFYLTLSRTVKYVVMIIKELHTLIWLCDITPLYGRVILIAWSMEIATCLPQVLLGNEIYVNMAFYLYIT